MSKNITIKRLIKLLNFHGGTSVKRKVAIILSSLLFLSTLTVYAGTGLYGYFYDYEKVKVRVNGQEVYSKVPGFIIDGSTVLPLRAVSEALGAIVKWNNDTRTANLIKPNVNMLFSVNPVQDRNENFVIYIPFGKIPQSKRYDFSFYLYSEVDNLPKESVYVKAMIVDPNGSKVAEGAVKSVDASDENSLVYVHPFKNINFDKNGTYKMQFLVKGDSTSNQYLVIGEKSIEVK